MRVPRARRKPAASAAALPKFLLKRKPRTRGSAAARSLMTSHDPSALPSSTKMISAARGPATAAISVCNAAKLSRSLYTGTTSDSAGSVIRVLGGRRLVAKVAPVGGRGEVIQDRGHHDLGHG